MQILVWGGIIDLILIFNGSMLAAMGHPFWIFCLESLNVSLNIIAYLVAVRYSILTVAFAYIISNFLVMPASLFIVHKLAGISWQTYFKQPGVPIISAITMAAFILLMKRLLYNALEPSSILLVCTLSGMVFYFLTLQLIAPSLFHELWHLVRGRIN